MKRAGNLIGRIAEPENIRLAFWKAAKGKWSRPADVLDRLLRHLGRIVSVLLCLPQERRDLLDPWIGPTLAEGCELGRVDQRLDEGRRVIDRRPATAGNQEEEGQQQVTDHLQSL